MKRIAMFTVSFGVALFAIGCGKTHDDRDAKHAAPQLSHEAAADVNRAAHDAEHAAQDLNHAVRDATVGTEHDVRQAAGYLRDDVRGPTEVIQVRGDNDAPRPADPAQLRQEVKRDAINAAGAAAEEAAEKLFKVK